jgi:hypothetical protein
MLLQRKTTFSQHAHGSERHRKKADASVKQLAIALTQVFT